jgi:hypothetical protein
VEWKQRGKTIMQRIVMIFLSASVAVAAIVGVACQEAPREPPLDANGRSEAGRQCDDINAQIEGIDTEIRLRYDQVFDVKYRGQAFGAIGLDLIKAAQKHTEEIVKLRRQRAELYYRVKSPSTGCSGWLPSPTDDRWEDYVIRSDKWKGVRDPSAPEGYSVKCISASG